VDGYPCIIRWGEGCWGVTWWGYPSRSIGGQVMVKTVDWGVVLPSEYRGVDKTRRMGQDGLLAIGLAW